MRDFLTKSCPGLLAVVAVAGLGYFVLTPPKPTARMEVAGLGFHSADCRVCGLPMVARGAEPSRYGHNFQESAATQTH
jgi:hypothetical protein